MFTKVGAPFLLSTPQRLRGFQKPCHTFALRRHLDGEMKFPMPVTATPSDTELVQSCLTTGADAFSEIVTRYQSLICALTYNATGNLARSEDLAQEVFLIAWKDLRQLREPAKLRAWLCGITRRLTAKTR